jgi:hypothetical protein
MWIIIIVIGVALLIDFIIYTGNPPRGDQKKPYYPNLRIWGLGLMAGIGMFVATLFAQAIQKLVWYPPPAEPSWVTLAPLFFLAAVLGILIWGIVSICQSE